MIESRCGLLCGECSYREQMNCKGCTEIDKPFWGDCCPIKACCEGKKLEHCGLCDSFPCGMLKQFAYDEKQGDNGKRLAQCETWRGNTVRNGLRFSGPLFMVKDIKTAVAFYQEILGQRVAMDLGINVTFEGGFSLQQDYTQVLGIAAERMPITYHANAAELYFETETFDAFIEKLDAHPEIERMFDVHVTRWGQRDVIFYDPDGHLIEIGETMELVIKRHLRGGMTVDEVLKLTEYPLPFIQHCQETL